MKKFSLKYLIFTILFCVAFSAYSQDNEATVTIIGNALDNNAVNQFNPVQTNQPPPPAQQEFAPVDQNIEPTVENGFHMRFQIESPASVERLTTVSSYSGSAGASGGAKARKKNTSMAERSFNVKKKVKNWIPKRKKKYHPTLCEKFR